MSKLTYIAGMFSRAQNKIYENYVVTAIYHKLQNYDLKPVTQQKVISPTDPSKYYLLDLYFPQLNYGIEIDEPAHEGNSYHFRDIARADDVFNAIQCKEKTIKIPENYDIAEVNRQIDIIVRDIQSLASAAHVVWKENDEMRKEAIDKRLIEVDDGIDYGGFSRIYAYLTGNTSDNYTRYQWCFSKKTQMISGMYLWVPKLTVEINGKVFGDPNWSNIISSDKTEIKETSHKRNNSLPVGKVENGEKRIVFIKAKDEFERNNVTYFAGIFQHVENIDGNTAVYKRIGTQFRW